MATPPKIFKFSSYDLSVIPVIGYGARSTTTMIDFLSNLSQLWDKLKLKNAPGQNLFVWCFFCNPTNPTQYWLGANLGHSNLANTTV